MAALILIADDEKDVVEFLAKVVGRLGYRVATAVDAYSTMAAIRAEKPDLILLDYMMPAGSGGDVLRNLRGNEFGADIPVIFLSALPKFEVEQKIPYLDNRVRVLEKPLDVEALKVCLAELLGPKAAAAQPEPPADPAA